MSNTTKFKIMASEEPAGTLKRTLNRALLREAGEHLGTLAEQRKEVYDTYIGHRGASETRKKFWNSYAKLSRLSREILEIAND